MQEKRRQGLEIRAFQEAIRLEYYKRDSARGLYATFAWLVEEIGELATALLSGNTSSIEEEIADVIAWTVSIANLAGIDVEHAIFKKYGSILDKKQNTST